MAEMDTSSKGGGKHGGGKRAKKGSTRVDLTAMVDLGFLLITFFMLATTMNKPKTMEINKPAKEDDVKDKDKPIVKMSKTLSLLLGDNDKVYWYVSPDEVNSTTKIEMDSVDYGPNGVRRIVKRRLKEVLEQHGLEKDGTNGLFVMIKPLPGSKLKNTVDVLDEMTINDVKRYAILEVNDPIDSLVALQVGQKRK
jgi:biopolymer transport protein ExbD